MPKCSVCIGLFFSPPSYLIITLLTSCSCLQAAMCYVHVAALVAEYLRRKGALTASHRSSQPFHLIWELVIYERCLYICHIHTCVQGWSNRAAQHSVSSRRTLTKRERWWRTWACRTSISMKCVCIFRFECVERALIIHLYIYRLSLMTN